jgi:hypothetical protein
MLKNGSFMLDPNLLPCELYFECDKCGGDGGSPPGFINYCNFEVIKIEPDGCYNVYTLVCNTCGTTETRKDTINKLCRENDDVDWEEWGLELFSVGGTPPPPTFWYCIRRGVCNVCDDIVRSHYFIGGCIDRGTVEWETDLQGCVRVGKCSECNLMSEQKELDCDMQWDDWTFRDPNEDVWQVYPNWAENRDTYCYRRGVCKRGCEYDYDLHFERSHHGTFYYSLFPNDVFFPQENPKAVYGCGKCWVCRTSPLRPPLQLGNVTGSGTIDVMDALEILKHLAGITTLTGSEFNAALVTGGNEPTIQDVLEILKYIAGIIDSL